MVERLQRVTGAYDEVFLTGATGFVGSHILRALLAAHYRVRALVRPGSRPLPLLEGCTTISGDILRSGDLVQHMVGCRYLVHEAALYSFSPGMREQMFDCNLRLRAIGHLGREPRQMRRHRIVDLQQPGVHHAQGCRRNDRLG